MIQMEIKGIDTPKLQLEAGQKMEFGRGSGFDSTDKTVSRRQISLHLPASDEARVHFEVIGKNPIWVYHIKVGETRVYKRHERGEMESGDMFCVSAKKTVWFHLKSLELGGQNVDGVDGECGVEDELADRLQSGFAFRGVEELELESIDVSTLDPVKEFGFVVMGREFDCYPKKMIRHITNWDWFIEEPKEESDDDERKGKKGVTRKRKKSGGGEDDDWTGESEEDKEVITKSRKVQRPKYLTRSKDSDRPKKGNIGRSRQKYNDEEDEEVEDEHEDDETLGGFIVDEENVEEEIGSDEDDEEEFDEDNDDEEE